jgi:hypothetical protein
MSHGETSITSQGGGVKLAVNWVFAGGASFPKPGSPWGPSETRRTRPGSVEEREFAPHFIHKLNPYSNLNNGRHSALKFHFVPS